MSNSVTIDYPLANGIRIGLIFVGVIFILGQFRWNNWFAGKTNAINAPGTGIFAPDRLIFIWWILPIVLLAMMSLSRANIFSIYPHFMLYQPRFLIVCWPATVLLLVMALRNLPNPKRMPLQVISIGLIGSIMLASSLMNQLIFVLPPHNQIGITAKPYVLMDGAASIVLIESQSRFVDIDEIYACQVALGYRLKFDRTLINTWRPEIKQMPVSGPLRISDNPTAWHKALATAASQKVVRTIITFDRLGDTPLLSDSSLLESLGTGWSKAQQTDCRLLEQWHPYLSFGYRARVWRRIN